MRAGRIASLGLIGALALFATGCGEGKETVKPGTAISAAIGKTTTGSARLVGSSAIEAQGHHLEIQRMTGEQDFAHRSSRMELRSPLSEIDPSRDDMVVDIVSISGVAYERITGLEYTGGQRWVRISAADLGVAPDASGSLGSGDPADGLRFLDGVQHIQLAGLERVRGVDTTHYSVTIDIDRILDLEAKGAEKISPSFTRSLQALRNQVDLAHLPGGVWLDDQGRVRRLRYSLAPPSERGTSIVTTLEYFDFGAPVSVSPPPPGDTASFSDVADQLRQYLSSLKAAASPAA